MTDEEAGADGSGDDGRDDRSGIDAAGAASPIEAGEYWDRMLEDVAASADEHRRAGYRTVVLDPEASGTVDREEPGLAVVVPPAEFAELDGVVSVREVDEYEVLRGETPRQIHVLVQFYTADGDAAVLLPAAVDRDALTALREAVGDTFYLHVTPPEDDETVTFTLDDPSLFFPATEGPAPDPERNGTGG
jgi:hypothetical protein